MSSSRSEHNDDLHHTISLDEKDFYKILNINHDATLDVIKKSFHKLALTYHPDKKPHLGFLL